MIACGRISILMRNGLVISKRLSPNVAAVSLPLGEGDGHQAKTVAPRQRQIHLPLAQLPSGIGAHELLTETECARGLAPTF